MEFEYPEKPKQTHRIIVKKLLQGEFISIGKREYEVLWGHKEWYESFFLDSFNIEDHLPKWQLKDIFRDIC